MKMHVVLFALFLLLFSLTNASFALIGIGPRVGYYEAKDADKGEYFVGAAARFKLLGLAFEGAVDYRAEKYNEGRVTVRSWPVTLSALYYPISIIYGLAGCGWYHTTLHDNQKKIPPIKDKTTTELGWHMGVGVQLPVGRNAKLAADVRYVFLNYDFVEIPKDTNSDFFAITISLLWNVF